jgi:hypothetical protein
MLTLDQLRSALANGRYRLSDHALSRVVERNLSAEMIREAGAQAEIIEDYPVDKYSPSCLILGFTEQKMPLHIHVSRADNPSVKIITLYVPDPDEWIDDRIRRRKT